MPNPTLEARLQELENEYRAGQKLLAELEAKRQEVTSTLLRIEGATQLLRELMAEDEKRNSGK